MIKSIGLSVVVKDIQEKSEVDLMVKNLLNVFPKQTTFDSYQEYPKFENAYKIEFSSEIQKGSSKEMLIYQMLEIANSIASPWFIYFDKDGDNTELIFNKDMNTQFTDKSFSKIFWAQIQLIY